MANQNANGDNDGNRSGSFINSNRRNTGTDYARSMSNSLKSGIDKLTLGIGPGLFKTLTKSINDVFGGLSKKIKDSFKNVFSSIGGAMELVVGKKIFDVLVKITLGIKNLIGGLLDTLNGAIGRVMGFVGDVLTNSFKKFMEIQKSVGNLSANIGLSKEESKGLLFNFTELSLKAMEFGGELGDISKMISIFSDITGKNKLFDKEDVSNIEKIGRGTSLGVDGLTQMLAEFSNLGIAATKVYKLVGIAVTDSTKFGINSKKVLETYSALVTNLTGFQMKSGLDNMVKLATQATQLRMDITQVSNKLSEQFFDPEGAVEAAAKMQVLGGQFAEKFGDAFEIMYKAQISPEEFGKDLMDITKGLATKNNEGIFYIPPASMRLLREAANDLGVDFQNLKNGAIEQAKLADKLDALGKKGIFFRDDKDKTAIANLIEFDKDKGGYLIRMPDGEKQLLSKLTNQSQFNAIIETKKVDDEAAKKRMSFSERLSLIFDRFYMSFTQVFANVFDSLERSGFLVKLEDFGNRLISVIVPYINKVFGENGGFGQLLDNIFKNLTNLVDKLNLVLNTKGEGLWGMIKDMAVTAIKGIWDIVSPYLATGFSNLAIAIGNATGLDFVRISGEKGALDAATKNDYLATQLSSSGDKDKYTKDINNHIYDLSAKQIGAAIGIGILSVVAAPLTGGTSLAFGASMATTVGLGESAYNQMTVEPVNDALMTPSGKVFKGGKGDIGVLFDQAALKQNNGSSQPQEIKHTGTITVRSEDGKEITINDLDKIGRYTLANYINSLNYGFKNGNVLLNNEKMPITPISK